MHHVLIVDDSPTEVHVLRTLLEEQGYRTTVATTGADGIDKAKETKPDVIVMDVVMPGMNGFQATRQLTRDPETAAIPVILVSVKSMPSDEAWGLRQGACAYLTKPYTREVLLDTLRRHLP